ncbi:MAG: hypothetical protein JSV88_03120 [Candidatus Aminicenantes bacterium]|nr:MAG: hypothetical protein JSV88_03120 [Candidatus Aminicenantes bacterium]
MRKGLESIEAFIQDMDHRVENLKVQFNLFFSGEIRIPPEKEREELETRIRNLMSRGHKSPRVNLLIQNLGSRFSLYNNMWLKRLNELETGISVIKRKKTAYTEESKPPPKPIIPKVKPVNVDVSLNSEDSFEKFFDNYSRLLPQKNRAALDKEKVINSIKTKLITANLVDAQVNLSLQKGKVKIKIKPSQ